MYSNISLLSIDSYGLSVIDHIVGSGLSPINFAIFTISFLNVVIYANILNLIVIFATVLGLY